MHRNTLLDFEKSMWRDPLMPGGLMGMKETFWPIIQLMDEKKCIMEIYQTI